MPHQLIHPTALAYTGWDLAYPFEASNFVTFPNLSMRAVLYLGLTWPFGRTVRQVSRACHMPLGSVYNTLMRLCRADVLEARSLPGYRIAQLYALRVPGQEGGPDAAH